MSKTLPNRIIACFLFFGIFCGMLRAEEFAADGTIHLTNGITLKLKARKVAKEEGPPNDSRYGAVVFEDKLYVGSGGFRPFSVLEAANLQINGQNIPLEVSGLANPWISKPYKPWFHIEQDGKDYLLQAAFSDGAEIYIVKWLVFGGRSTRLSIDWLGDKLIPWLKKPEPETSTTSTKRQR